MMNGGKRKKYSFQISIGDDGVVVTYCSEKTVVKRLYIPIANNEGQISKLENLLEQDSVSPIHIYLDTSDQIYMQKMLPAISVMSVGKMAQQRLEREFQSGYLKHSLRIGRSEVGRKDWIYTFIAAPINSALKQWLDFFMKYQNIIEGIYFLPVELSSVVSMLGKAAISGKAQLPVLLQIKEMLVSNLKKQSSNNVWDILFLHNKSGGYRQVVYQAGNVVFSRMVSNSHEVEVDVIAGNIEQDIEGAIEYLSRIGFEKDHYVRLYIVISNEVGRHIRVSRFKVNSANIYTPYEFDKILGMGASSHNDKFADPIVLGFMAKNPKRLFKVFTPQIEKVYNISMAVKFGKYALQFLICMMILCIAYSGYQSFVTYGKIQDLDDKARSLSSEFAQNVKQSNDLSDVEHGAGLEQINEIVDIHRIFSVNIFSPIDFIYKLFKVTPEEARIKSISWIFDDPFIFNVMSGPEGSQSSPSSKDYTFTLSFNIVLQHENFTLESLNAIYTSYVVNLKESFSEYDVHVSALPTSFSFARIKEPIPLDIKISYPKSEEGR